MTKERPLAFTPDMVRAERAGVKTMTRRVLRTQPPEDCGQLGCGIYSPPVVDRYGDEQPGAERFGAFTADGSWASPCPYGQPGDQLWVREHYRVCDGLEAKPPRDLCPAARIWYEADAPHQPGFGKFRPAMFMCRWMSRTLLEITSVRVERLQDITRGDCMAEGCPFPNIAGGTDPVRWYRELWEQINGPGSWDANTYVWVIEFKRINP